MDRNAKKIIYKMKSFQTWLLHFSLITYASKYGISIACFVAWTLLMDFPHPPTCAHLHTLHSFSWPNLLRTTLSPNQQLTPPLTNW